MPSTPASRIPVRVSILSLIKYIFILISILSPRLVTQIVMKILHTTFSIVKIYYATCVKIRNATMNPQRAIPSARATKIRALPNTLESSLNAPRAALAELATA